MANLGTTCQFLYHTDIQVGTFRVKYATEYRVRQSCLIDFGCVCVCVVEYTL